MSEEELAIINAKLDFIADVSIIAATNQSTQAKYFYKKFKRDYEEIEKRFK